MFHEMLAVFDTVLTCSLIYYVKNTVVLFHPLNKNQNLHGSVFGVFHYSLEELSQIATVALDFNFESCRSSRCCLAKIGVANGGLLAPWKPFL